MRRGDLRAAVEIVADDGEVEHVGGQHAVVDDVGALLAHAFDEGGGERRRRHAHVARDADRRRLQIGGEAAADLPGDVLVDLARVEAADVVGLEDVWIDLHVISMCDRNASDRPIVDCMNHDHITTLRLV